MSQGVTRKPCPPPPPVTSQDMTSKVQDASNTGADNRPDTTRQRSRRQPCCGFCRNHNLEVPVINHHCEYVECTCVLCELTRRRKKVMRHQQRLWRHKKFSAGQKDNEENNTCEGEVTPNRNYPHDKPQMDLLDPSKQTPRRKMVCDKCRNHNVITNKRGHKGSCPYEECTCNLCTFTIKRQQLMKHQQRVRRSQIASPTNHTERTQAHPLKNADSPDSDLHPQEEPASTTPPTDTLEGRKAEETDAKRSPVSAAPLDVPPTEEWNNAVKECARDDAPLRQDNHFHTITTNTTCQPPPLEPLPDYPVTSDIHSSLTFNKSEHNLNSSSRIECSQNMRLSVRCGCFGPLPQISAASASLPSFRTYGLDVGPQRFVPWTGRVSEMGERCIVEANNNNNNNNVRPQVPFRPQPIPARPPRPQMDWQFIGFPYSPASMLQSVPQPTLSVCDNFRGHHPPAGLNEQWHGPRGAHTTEGGGVHSPYSAGLPYFTNALLHPSAKPSLSLMPTSRTLPEYGSPLHGFRQRDEHQVNHLGAFTRSCNNLS